jgi:hypothetical protein
MVMLPTTTLKFDIINLLIVSSRVSPSSSSPSSSGINGFGKGMYIGVGTFSKSGISIRGLSSNGYFGTLIAVSILREV